MEGIRDKLTAAVVVLIFGGAILLTLVGEGVIEFGVSEYPQKITREQLGSLRVTSVISDWCLPDSISHYVDSIVLRDSSAMLFEYDRIGPPLDMIETSLQQLGFVITDRGNSKIDSFDFYWVSGENGDIFAHITMLRTATKTFVSVASGKSIEDVLSIKIVSDGVSAELSSDRSYTPANAEIVRTAPLAGTIYAIYYSSNPLCGSAGDEINVAARQSFDEVLARVAARSAPINATPEAMPNVDFYWACMGFCGKASFKPTHRSIHMPRGVAYAIVNIGYGGYGVK